ncbi:PrtD family type I secretion system ABC transporter [Agrobacterium vitis]|nr:PrtD family type I secretion system ABC transporter [Agrobacterium vitis]MBE1438305.1 PrtD family type I secretion system ABC transporter [Agrobacterium vitis]
MLKSIRSTNLGAALAGAVLFSGVVNILALAGPLFMLEVYDRVIPTKNIPTLVALLVLMVGLYAFSGVLDIVRGRVMSRIAGIFDGQISRRVLAVIAGSPLRVKMQGDVLKPAQEADQIRAFTSGPGPIALFDLPWIPVYLVICFFLHPLIGWLATASMVLLVASTLVADLLTRRRTKQMSEALSRRNRFGEAVHRNAEAVASMGLLPQVLERWTMAHDQAAELQRKTGDISNLFFGLSKIVRQMVQSGTLALGAWLVISGDLTGGGIIAASTIIARALQPIEQMIGNWRNMVGAYQAWGRLQAVFKLFPEVQARTQLPPPSRSLLVEGAFVAPPGERQRMTVQNVSFRASAGSVIGIIGPSASGKSSLVRALTGVWPLARGRVCLDGAALDHWPVEERGRHIGYMPQSSDLFPGTIAENIARLDSQAPHADIIAAAQAAGVHEMIVALPDGYETQVGDGGVNLSSGQRQRVALARALYGNPFLVVLDEPNSNLDTDGDKALSNAIAGVKARGGIVIVVAHRNSIVAQLDFLLVMENTTVKAFGPRDGVLKSMQQPMVRPPRAGPPPMLTVVDGEAQ